MEIAALIRSVFWDTTKAEMAAFKMSVDARTATKPPAMIVQTTEKTFALNAILDIT